MSLRNIIRNLLPYKYRIKLKKGYRKLSNSLKKDIDKVSLSKMRLFLTEGLGISKGDSLMITSSFGNLNTNFTPKELVELLQEVVGKEGNIAMPFYPPGSSKEWAESGIPFDMRTTKSAVGVLSQVFSEMDDVYKSKHPTKAVVTWGRNAKEIIVDHEKSTTPFYWDSPYGWFLKNDSKSVGLGVKNIPIAHAIEDVEHDDFSHMYLKEKASLKVIDYDGSISTHDVLIHGGPNNDNLIQPRNYIDTLELKSYKLIPVGYAVCFSVVNKDFHNKCKQEIMNNRYRKA